MAEPTWVQVWPSAEVELVMVSPVRASLSQGAAGWLRLTLLSKLYWKFVPVVRG